MQISNDSPARKWDFAIGESASKMTTIRLIVQRLARWLAFPALLNLIRRQRVVLLHKTPWIQEAALIVLAGPLMLILSPNLWAVFGAFWASALASVAILALALQNQTLQRRTHQVSALLEISNRVGSSFELQSLIPLMLESAKVALPYDDALVIERRGNNQLHTIGYSGPDQPHDPMWEYEPERDLHLRHLFETRAPLIIPDILADEPLAKTCRNRIVESKGYLPKRIRSCLYVPLLRRNEIVGYFILNSTQANAYRDKDLLMANGLSHQFAMCIENARLYESAMQITTLTERNRIARELHDSISQALFGIVLGMRTLAEASRLSPSKMEEAMNYVVRLADMALVEIRALIFELRPEYLEKEGLIAALKKQVEGLCLRYQIELKMQVSAEETRLSGRAKEALYRIGLEATRNTIKHANARTIQINLNEVGQQSVTLEINDDGNGFDPNASFDGRLGIVSMREHAQQFGGDFEVLSQHGQGTTVRVSIPIPA